GPADNINEHAFSAHRCFVKIYLPVHQPSGSEKIFDAVNSFFLYNKLIAMNVKHGNDPVNANGTFHHTGEKTIAFQVIEPVDIELAGHELMKEFAFITVP